MIPLALTQSAGPTATLLRSLRYRVGRVRMRLAVLAARRGMPSRAARAERRGLGADHDRFCRLIRYLEGRLGGPDVAWNRTPKAKPPKPLTHRVLYRVIALRAAADRDRRHAAWHGDARSVAALTVDLDHYSGLIVYLRKRQKREANPRPTETE